METVVLGLVQIGQEILNNVTNVITPRALFPPTYLLNLVKPELAPFDPPTPTTPP